LVIALTAHARVNHLGIVRQTNDGLSALLVATVAGHTVWCCSFSVKAATLTKSTTPAARPCRRLHHIDVEHVIKNAIEVTGMRERDVNPF